MAKWNSKLADAVLERGAEHNELKGPGLRLQELPARGKLMLRTRLAVADTHSRISQATGIKLPLAPNTASRNEHPVLWIGPGQWLINVPASDLQKVDGEISTALGNCTFLLSDISDARVVVSLSGPRVPALMSRMCPLDLDLETFVTGRCAQSLLARVPMLLHRVSDEPGFHLYVDRSHAHYAWDWLSDAALAMGAQDGAV